MKNFIKKEYDYLFNIENMKQNLKNKINDIKSNIDNNILVLDKYYLYFFEKNLISNILSKEEKYSDFIKKIEFLNFNKKKFLFLINEYNKNINVFGWNYTLYKYMKSNNLYIDIELIQYKFLEYFLIKYFYNKSIWFLWFFPQFLDFVLTKWQIVNNWNWFLNLWYDLYWNFIKNLLKVKSVGKMKIIYNYYSILNIELNENIWIWKLFKWYPLIIKKFIYELNKNLESIELRDQQELLLFVENSILDSTILSKKYKEWDIFYLLKKNIFDILMSEYWNISYIWDEKIIDNLDNSWEDYYEINYQNNFLEKMEKIFFNISKYSNIENEQIMFYIKLNMDKWLLDINKILYLNNKFKWINNQTLIWLFNIIHWNLKNNL